MGTTQNGRKNFQVFCGDKEWVPKKKNILKITFNIPFTYRIQNWLKRYIDNFCVQKKRNIFLTKQKQKVINFVLSMYRGFFSNENRIYCNQPPYEGWIKTLIVVFNMEFTRESVSFILVFGKNSKNIFSIYCFLKENLQV